MSHSTTPDTDASTLLLALKEVLRERRIDLSEKPGAHGGPERTYWKLAIAAGPGTPEERAPIIEI